MSGIKQVVQSVNSLPVLGKWVNRVATHYYCTTTSARPRPFSLWSHQPKPEPREEWGEVGEYTTWPMLIDKQFSARHLAPAERTYVEGLPEDTGFDPQTQRWGEVTELFRRQGPMQTDRSSLLFMFFAQWFTDSVLRIDSFDRRKNTSNHNIDLCQIYGLKETTTRLLRTGNGGLLRSQQIRGEEFPDCLGELDQQGQWQVKPHYRRLPYASAEKLDLIFGSWPQERRHRLYATGLERGNSSIGYVAVSTLFLREHNRICRALQAQYTGPQWDDERLFQTARMINIVILMKLVVEEYINHIAGYPIFKFDPGFAERTPWYRDPWISMEFDLLYRWHGLVPTTIKVRGKDVDHTDFRVNNQVLEDLGLGELMTLASTQAAGKIGLGNVPDFLLGAEHATLRMGREFRLQSFNAYRRAFRHPLFGIKPLKSFAELTDDVDLQRRLRDLYKHIDNVEFVVGLFAEKPGKQGALFGDLLNAMVAYDAFTQIYTNPLLSKSVYNEQTFTRYGLDLIEQTRSVQDLLARNSVAGQAGFSV
ncbi:MAG: peroxidase family protein [Pseudomonadota bacterium]|nr:peroxidase family protein [Pseudomonadota bacterium]